MNQSDVLSVLQNKMGNVYDKIESDGIDQAVSEASQELAWSLPIDDSLSKKCFWFCRRAYRWALNILVTESAHKFKHKQESLQHRFAHYTALIEKEDAEFKDALENDPALFAGVDVTKMFGETIGTGFQYDLTGRDISFESEPSTLDVQKKYLGLK